MYAIILTGGKQYRVAEGENLVVDKLAGKAGEEVILDKVLMIREKDKSIIGTPVVKDAKIIGEVLRQGREAKVICFKRRAKKGYQRTKGHRQDFTEVKIKKIEYTA